MEVFIAGAEQGLDIRAEFYAFFHSGVGRRLQQPDRAHGSILVSGTRVTARLGRTCAGVFYTQIAN